jgi:hypothetical protein
MEVAKMATMVKHLVLCKKTGENATTAADPIRLYNEATDAALLTVTDSFCVSFDNDMLVSCKVYEVREVELPEWLSVEEWCANTTKWKYTWGFGVKKDWPEAIQRFVSEVEGEGARLAVVKLLETKKFKSEFRKSLRAQLDEFIATPAADRKYKDPFSRKQWDCLVDRYVAREASQISSSLYHSRGYLAA